MTFLTLTLRNVCCHWRINGLLLTGAALASACLTGVMLADDLISLKLKESALVRLGNIEWALDGGAHFFPANLAGRIMDATSAQVTPALRIYGMAENAPSGTATHRITPIQILGVEESFWSLTRTRDPALSPDSLALNQQLASTLQVKTGDRVSIHFPKPALISRTAPLFTPEPPAALHATFTVNTIVGDPQPGRFDLEVNRPTPCTAFVSLTRLQQVSGLEAKANLLLAVTPPSAAGAPTINSSGLSNLNGAVRTVWRLEDIGLHLRTIGNGRLFQLECDRILMPPALDRTRADMSKSVGALTYPVNSIARTGDQPALKTPDSLVIALSPAQDTALGAVTPGMRDDEIIISPWLAGCLNVRPGDSVTLAYYRLGATNERIETNRTFTVRRLAEPHEMEQERELSTFPPGRPLAGRATEQTNAPPATPKAFVTLKAGQEMWAGRAGELTAVRFRSHEGGHEAVTDVLLHQLDPTLLGLAFTPARTTAIQAASETVDLGDVFRGLSFCLMAAGLLFIGMMFAHGVERRHSETRLLLALGFRSGQLRRLWIQECLLITLTGAALGAFLGPLYMRTVIRALGWMSGLS